MAGTLEGTDLPTALGTALPQGQRDTGSPVHGQFFSPALPMQSCRQPLPLLGIVHEEEVEQPQPSL